MPAASRVATQGAQGVPRGAPTNTPRAAAAARKKAAPAGVSQTVSRLGLAEPREALLCLPQAYTDCRHPQRRLPDQSERGSSLYLLTHTGDIRGFDKDRKLVINVGRDGFDPALIRRVKYVDIDLRDECGTTVTMRQFGSGWGVRDICSGDPALVIGRVVWSNKHGVSNCMLFDTELPPARVVNRIWVRYSGIPGRVTGESVEALVRQQLDNPDAWQLCAAKLVGATGQPGRQALEAVGDRIFESFEHLLRTLHAPTDLDDAYYARAVCNRLAAYSIEAAALRHHVRHPHSRAPLAISEAVIEAMARTQKERLSEEQWAAIRGVAAALRGPKPLNGLLSGDVGTGKTLTFLIPAVAAHQAGAQVAIMAPTDLLANQIAAQAQGRFGAHARIERVLAGKKIVDPGAILIGTPGFVTVAKKSGYRPNLLICDEQHKMGADSRETLAEPWTHVLDVSATPVPRTLATALYGGMQIFNLRKCPVDKRIGSRVYDVADRRRALGAIKWALDAGKKAAVIYPRVNTKSADSKTVLSAAQVFERAFPGKVAVLHGGLSAAEEAQTMELIRAGDRPLVVGSTVMEIGIDIPGMAAMVVRDADHFGVAQLHQLRGRLARNGGEGWFIMMVEALDNLPEETAQRLNAVASTTDGYELAEMDLRQRGFGDLDGEQQTGATNGVFKLVQLKAEDFLGAKLAKADPFSVPSIARGVPGAGHALVDACAGLGSGDVDGDEDEDEGAERPRPREQQRLFG